MRHLSSIVWLSCVAFGTAAHLANAAEESVPEHAKPLLGCWKSEKDERAFVRFEAAKVTFAQGGEVEIFRARYAPGTLLLRPTGRTLEMKTELKDGKLTLTAPGQESWTYTRLEQVPPELELKPLALGTLKEVPPERLKTIQSELATRLKTDQGVRTDPAQREKMGAVDADNTAWLVKELKELGWIDAQRFGRSASNTAFLIVQHSGDLPLMLAALPEIEKDLKSGVGDPQDFALLYDRLQLRLGNKQRYGSQIGMNEKGEPVVLPLEDRAHVEKLRKDLGLFPLTQYLAMMKQQTGKEVKFGEEE